jgi:type VI secretion system protein ImpA
MYPIRVQTTFEFDVEALLSPIPGESAAGQSLRYEGTYDRIRDARTEDDPVLSRGVWKMPLKRADWSDVAELCLDALQHRTKDLQIAGWLLEAWVHLYGFNGLREGLRAITGLCSTFWDELHPRSETGDSLEYRVAPIEWINEKLPPIIRLLPLTDPSSDDVKAYCWDDWESATRPRAGDSPKQGATQAQFQQSVLLTSTQFYLNLVSEVESAADAATELESLLDQYTGGHAPSLRQIADSLDAIRGLLVSILSRRDTSLPAPASAAQPAPDALEPAAQRIAHATVNSSSSSGPILSRDDAYRRLAEAADYLAITEPHSPTPYLVRRAIAWGGMRLEDLLPELVRNNNELGEIFRLLQIEKPPSK